MQTTNETTAKATGFGELFCPLCAAEAAVSVSLGDLSTFRCSSCDEEFDREAIDGLMEAAQKWARVLAWVDTAPAIDD